MTRLSLSKCRYASSVRMPSSTARAAAIVSGLPLKVPTCSYVPSAIMFISSGTPPIAPHGTPPPSALARQIRSGTTPDHCVAPPAETARPVFTSSNAR